MSTSTPGPTDPLGPYDSLGWFHPLGSSDSTGEPVASDDGRVLPRRRLKLDNTLDITPMIDVTFLLLIFFIVCGRPDVQAALSLPAAEYGEGVSRKESFVISVAAGDRPGSAAVYLADGKVGEPLAGDEASQETRIRTAVESARRGGLSEVLIKAEKEVRHREVARVMRAAGVEGMRLHLAVAEMH
jgi:biopolymer transport protein ExbD